MNDLHFMQLALDYSRRGIGRTSPNPSVGCLIVKDGKIIGRGRTADQGRPHAEITALTMAGKKAKKATAYLTMEPCVFTGREGPCAEALVKAGIARAVIAMRDPNPKICGKGIDLLQQAGIEIVTGIREQEAMQLHEGFTSLMLHHRPFVTLKLASTLDGKLATSEGSSQWISGTQAQRYAHLLRYRHDAVMVGIGTALADDPKLTCRLPGLENFSPIRVVVDSQLRLPQDAKMGTRLIITSKQSGEREIISVPSNEDGKVDLTSALQQLGQRGITRLLVEGGAQLAASLVKANLVDRLIWITAPKLIGQEGLASIGNLAIETLHHAPQFKLESTRQMGEDIITSYTRLQPVL